MQIYSQMTKAIKLDSKVQMQHSCERMQTSSFDNKGCNQWLAGNGNKLGQKEKRREEIKTPVVVFLTLTKALLQQENVLQPCVQTQLFGSSLP